MRFHLLIATVLRRRTSVEALLRAVAGQTVVPNLVHLVLDRYKYAGAAEFAAPECPTSLAVIEYRMPTTGGPGGRWRAARGMPVDEILVNLDDDMVLDAPDVIEALVEGTHKTGGVVSHLGVYPSGWSGVAPAGSPLIALAAGAMACRAGDLAGLEATRAEVLEKCGFDPFGPLGDDDALVSAHLWRRGIPIRATGPLAIYEAPAAQDGSQFQLRREESLRNGRPLFWQRKEIARVTGWPWVEVRT